MFLGSQGTGASTVPVLTNSSGHEKSYSKFLAACFIKLGLYRASSAHKANAAGRDLIIFPLI